MNVSQNGQLPRGEKGFTLIELLVVVLIIGILASIAIPQYFKVVEKGKLVDGQSWIGHFKESNERYSNQFGGYVTDENDFKSLDIEFAGGKAQNYGMQYFSVDSIGAGTAACSDGSVGFKIVLKRYEGKSKAPKRYGQYNVSYDSCEAAFKFTNCAVASACSDFQ
ncbi:MAG: prepilin-type N-terminal cleavage/methylation domain-containing protein [Elusimicrobiota bacterium]